MSRKGNYLGGGTVMRTGSDWFAKDCERTEKVHAQGKREGEISRVRLLNKELARKNDLSIELKKQLRYTSIQKQKAEIKRATLIASGKSTAPPEEGTKAARYKKEQDDKMEKVQVEQRKKRKITSRNYKY